MKIKRFSLREISIGVVVVYVIICALGLYCRQAGKERENELIDTSNKRHIEEDYSRYNSRGLILPHRNDDNIHILPSGYFGIFTITPRIRPSKKGIEDILPPSANSMYPKYRLRYKARLVKIFHIPIPKLLSSPSNFPIDNPEAYLQEWKKDSIYYIEHQTLYLHYIGIICFTVLAVISACAFLCKMLLTNPAKANAANLLGYVMAVIAISFFIETMGMGPVIVGSNPSHVDSLVGIARWIYVVPAWDVVMRQVRHFHVRRYHISRSVINRLHDAITTYEGVTNQELPNIADAKVNESDSWILSLSRLFMTSKTGEDLLDHDSKGVAGGTIRTPDVSIADLLIALSRTIILCALRHSTARTSRILVVLQTASQRLIFDCDSLISVLSTQRQIDLRVLQQQEELQRQLMCTRGAVNEWNPNLRKQQCMSSFVLQNLTRAHEQMKSRKKTAHTVRMSIVCISTVFWLALLIETVAPDTFTPNVSIIFACFRMFMEMVLEALSLTIVLFLATMSHDEEMETSEALSLAVTLLEMQDLESRAERERARAESASNAARRKLLAWVMHEVRGPANILQLGLDDLENKMDSKLEELRGKSHLRVDKSPSPTVSKPHKDVDVYSSPLAVIENVVNMDSDPQSCYITSDAAADGRKTKHTHSIDGHESYDCGSDPICSENVSDEVNFVDEAILAVQLLRTSVESIASVMDSTLTLSSTSQDLDPNSYKFKCSIVPNSLPSMLRNVGMTLRPLILKADANLKITVDSHFLTGPLLHFDSNRVTQVLRNFVLNALKWIPQNQNGKVELQATLDDVVFIEDSQNWRMKTGCHVQGRVSIVHPLHVHNCPRRSHKGDRYLSEVWIVRLNCIDNGVGIPAQDIKHLFKPYSQVRSGGFLPDAPKASATSGGSKGSSSLQRKNSSTDDESTMQDRIGEQEQGTSTCGEGVSTRTLFSSSANQNTQIEGNSLGQSAIGQLRKLRGIDNPREDMLPQKTSHYTQIKHSKGTGLGLAISKGIAEEHGGYVKAVSEIGKGSIFSCILPLRAYRPTKKSSIESLEMPPPIRIFAPVGEVKEEPPVKQRKSGDIFSSSIYPSSGSTMLTYNINAAGSSRGVSETKLEGSGYGHFTRRDSTVAVSPHNVFTLKVEDLPLRFLVMTLDKSYQSSLVAKLKALFQYSRFVTAKNTKEVLRFVDCTHVVSKMEKIICDNPTLHLLHPVYHPFDVILIEIDDENLEDSMHCIQVLRGTC